MAAVTLGVQTGSDANASTYATGAFTPAASDLLLAIAGCQDTQATGTYTSDDAGKTLTKITHGNWTGTTDRLFAFVGDQLADADSQTGTMSVSGDGALSCVQAILRISGMSKTGLTAIRQSKVVNNAAGATTPSITFDAACLTDNPTIFAVCQNGTGEIDPGPTDWTKTANISTADISTRLVGWTRNSGFTGTTITAGDTAGSHSIIAIELDASAGTTDGVGTAAGTGAAPGVGASTAASAASASGTGAASGVGASTAAAQGAAAGSGAASGVGASTAAATGAAAGIGAAAAAGVSTAAATGSAAGAGTATGVGGQDGIQSAAGSAAGTGTATGVGASIAAATGTATATGSAAGTGTGIKPTVGSAAGTSSVSGTGAATFSAIASAIGSSDALAIGAAIWAAIGTAAGVGAAQAFSFVPTFDPPPRRSARTGGNRGASHSGGRSARTSGNRGASA